MLYLPLSASVHYLPVINYFFPDIFVLCFSSGLHYWFQGTLGPASPETWVCREHVFPLQGNSSRKLDRMQNFQTPWHRAVPIHADWWHISDTWLVLTSMLPPFLMAVGSSQHTDHLLVFRFVVVCVICCIIAYVFTVLQMHPLGNRRPLLPGGWSHHLG